MLHSRWLKPLLLLVAGLLSNVSSQCSTPPNQNGEKHSQSPVAREVQFNARTLCRCYVAVGKSWMSISYLYIVTFAVLSNSFEICETVQQRSPTCGNFFLQEHLQLRHLYIFSTHTAVRALAHRKRQGALLPFHGKFKGKFGIFLYGQHMTTF